MLRHSCFCAFGADTSSSRLPNPKHGPKRGFGTLGGAAVQACWETKLVRALASWRLRLWALFLAGESSALRLACLWITQTARLWGTLPAALIMRRSGQQITWNNPQSGNSGTITPIRDGYAASGSYCRRFQQTITVGGQKQQAYGKACQQPDGSWKIVQ